ncbi:hypothetical protein [Alistipes sp. ZOR0009]|uniref:hypothetical protein n=1 Tax=Alistipes sp. ZOR0009 TaxID=1339253 RepID=UPI000646511A|nr:hypothetical protein [Alistipes sp. ZOR0009]
MFIQFLHGGDEHKPETQDYISWNYLEHKRKFIKIQGEYISNYYNQPEKKVAELNLWCEWEPQSVVIKEFECSQSKLFPKYLFNPYFDLSASLTKHIDYSFSEKVIKKLISLGIPDSIINNMRNIVKDGEFYDSEKQTPKRLSLKKFEYAFKNITNVSNVFSKYKEQILNASKNYYNRQNTDPFIFGENFNYFVCRQNSKKSFTKLTELKAGDVILFGSNKNKCDFILDTVFVVSDKPPIIYCPTNFEHTVKKEISDEYYNISFVSAFSKFLNIQRISQPNKGFKLYFGATYDNPINGMFSFTPVMLHEKNSKRGFKRPKIKIEDHIKDRLNTNFFATALNDSEKTKKLWEETVKQVLTDGQKLLLGTKFAMPINKTKPDYQIPDNVVVSGNSCIPELDEIDDDN